MCFKIRLFDCSPEVLTKFHGDDQGLFFASALVFLVRSEKVRGL